VRVRVTESYAPVDFARERFDAAIRVNENAPIVGAEAVAFLENFHGPVVAPHLVGPGPTGIEGLTRLTTGTRQNRLGRVGGPTPASPSRPRPTPRSSSTSSTPWRPPPPASAWA
jgi:hypothetical protein